MTAFFALITRDIKLAARASGDLLTLLLFFVMIGVLIPFAIGPDKTLLAKLAPGIVWIAAFLSTLLALDRLFRTDAEDGSLQALRHADLSLEMICLAKFIAHWITTVLPLILAAPLIAVMMNMDWQTFWRTELSLLVGTPALTAFGMFGAALTISMRRGGLIAPVLILPLSIPVLIFGVSSIAANAGPDAESSALLFLSGFSLIAIVIAPFATALALRMAED